ncbi:origin recognition complex subunit 4 [Coniothyrium glycines]
MDDSPRASKRRKLDGSQRPISSPSTQTSARKSSGRLASRTTSQTNGSVATTPDVDEESSAKRRGRPSKSATNGTPAKRAAARDIDVYDDIEGALSVEPSPRPTREQLRMTAREGTASSSGATDELQDATTTKRVRAPSAKAKAESGSVYRSLVKSKASRAAEPQDELAAGSRTPTSRTKTIRPPGASVRKATPGRTPSRKRQEKTLAVNGDDEGTHRTVGSTTPVKSRVTAKAPSKTSDQSLFEHADTIAVTPAQPPKRRRPLKERSSIPETEDELSEQLAPSSKKLTSSSRRRFNRTDHDNNREDERWSDTEVHKADEEEDEMDIDVDGNSVLGSVLDPTEPSPFNQPTSAQKAKGAPPVIYGDFAAGRSLDLLKTVIMERITGRRVSPLVGLDEEYHVVHRLVEHTISAGEGNSMLVIGARGSGKTALVNKVLTEVAKENGGEYHVVRLNGFIHTDDKIALREIWRQLGKEMEIEEDGSGPGKNYADTLATLLALLSHPSEQTGEVTNQVAKAVVFIMDEFDLFAQHPRQTLLYNLFDIAQSRKAPIAVLGLTTRIDVTNSLEKRVKSRFSHRYVHLRLAKTFTEFQEMCKACLLVQPELLSIEERGILEDGTKTAPAKKIDKSEVPRSILTEWNANINKLFSTPSFLTTHLAPTFYLSKSIPTILSSFLLPVATLSPTTPLYPSPCLSPPDSKLSLIPHLSTLALSLLIAACRLDIIHDSDTANFNMAYDEYVTLASRARIQSAAGGLSSSSSASKVWGKDVARREWEALVDLGLLMPVVMGQAGGFGMVRCDVSLEEVGEVLKGVKGGDKGLERWCRSL